MKLFFTYLRQHMKLWITLVLFFVIFCVSFALYHLPLGAVLYPAALCLLIGVAVMACDFVGVYRRHRALQEITAFSDLDSENLPSAASIESADYQQILSLLSEEQVKRQTLANTRYNDMIDYYTIWAHQIKTPIASMRLNLQNEDTPLSRKLGSDLFRIEQYVEMVLTFLRLDADSSDYVIRECDVDSMVRQAVKKFAGEFILRKLKLDYTPVTLQAVTDEKWLSFVIEQVLSNALKYTPSGSISIYTEGEYLCIRDTGIGIAPQDLPRIFEKGYTGCHGREDKKASGIGLYLCRRICNRLGHTITAESNLDEGTVIRIGLKRYHGVLE